MQAENGTGYVQMEVKLYLVMLMRHQYVEVQVMEIYRKKLLMIYEMKLPQIY
ncbi:MAG: hypothetical protein LBI53_03800 [Candidatus Peribacteria bacterium]|jgi:hypothetical protein|nr:hypothetical protein [Candidatus Peribacteria bacterium]